MTSSRSPSRRTFGITPIRAASSARSHPGQMRAAWLPPLQDGELVAQDQDFCGPLGLLTPDSRRHLVTRVVRRKINRKQHDTRQAPIGRLGTLRGTGHQVDFQCSPQGGGSTASSRWATAATRLTIP